MAQQNLVSGSIDEQTLNEALESIKSIDSRLDVLISLSPDERRHVVKLSKTHLNFVHDMYAISEQNPDFLPRSFDLDEMAADIKLARQLESLETLFSHLNQRLEDTLFAVKSDMYSNALEAYGYLQAAREGDGLDVHRQEMRKYFSRRRRNSEEDQEEESIALS